MSKKNSASPAESISKYFPKITKDNQTNAIHLETLQEKCASSSSSSSESPYKNCLSEIGNCNLDNSTNDFKDFASNAVSSKIVPKPKEEKTNVNTRKSRAKKPRQVSMKKYVNKSELDVNPDHLQMAIALSKSTFTIECADEILPESTTDKSEELKRVLDKYGFGNGKNKTHTPLKRRQPIDARKKAKTSRYRHIKPTLFLRTEEDRSALISGKISEIVDRNHLKPSFLCYDFDLSSEYLKDFKRVSSLVQIHNNGDSSSDSFYVKGWKYGQSEKNRGHLLKDWDKIGGREVSPVRSLENNKVIVDKSGNDDENLNEHVDELTIENKMQENCENNAVEVEKNEGLEKTQDNSEDNVQLERISHSPDLFSSDNEDDNVITTQLASSDKEIKQNEWQHSASVIDLCESSTEAPEFNENMNEKSTESIKTDGNLNKSLNFSEHLNAPSVCDLTQSDNEEKEDVAQNNLSENLNLVKSPLLNSNRNSARFSIGFDIDLTNSLNVTEYVNQLLMANNSADISKINEQSLNDSSKTIDYSFTGANNCEFDSIKSVERKSIATTSNFCRNKSADSLTSQSSQESIVISDDELNYSCAHMDEFNYNPPENDDFMMEFYSENDNDEKIETANEAEKEEFLSDDSFDALVAQSANSPLQQSLNKSETPERKAELKSIVTPNNADLVIKRENVTPMPNFEQMDTPNVLKQLNNFGLKPMKRQRGVQLLRHIYETTHPIVEDRSNVDSDDENKKCVKKRKLDFEADGEIEIVGDGIVDENEELIFETHTSKRFSSCRIPLQIVWHNFLCCNPTFRENLLRYEPLNLELLHKMIKAQGFKFNIKDLLTFLDKKCVVVKIAQNKKDKAKS